jgi:hypothetical protein
MDPKTKANANNRALKPFVGSRGFLQEKKEKKKKKIKPVGGLVGEWLVPKIRQGNHQARLQTQQNRNQPTPGIHISVSKSHMRMFFSSFIWNNRTYKSRLDRKTA